MDLGDSTSQTLPNNPLRFLAFPKEIRLMIYDYLPTTTRHHEIFQQENMDLPSRGPFGIIIVSKRIHCFALLLTCRQIQSEVHDFLKHRVSSEPLRILITDGEHSQSPLMEAVLCYMAPSACGASYDITMHEELCMNMLTSELDTPEKMDNALLLHRAMLEGETKKIEIVMQFWDDSGLPTDSHPPSDTMPLLGLTLAMFNHWIGGMSEKGQKTYMDITVRPMPMTEMTEKEWQIAQDLAADNSPSTDWEGQTWKVTLGGRLMRDEWKKEWEVGERFGVKKQ